MDAREQPSSNPYSSPNEIADLEPDYDTTFVESTAINSAVFRSAHRVYAGKSYLLRRTILLVGGPLLLAMGAFAIYRGMRTFAPMLLVGVGGYATAKGLAFDWFSQRLTRRLFGREALSEQDIRFSVEPEWLGILERDVESRFRYTVFMKWRLAEKHILLYRSKSLYQIVPIDQFRSEARSALKCRLEKYLGAPK